MDLGKKIQQVLKHYPSVYVHGLGAFKKVHQASAFDAQHNVFLPPIDYVEFDDRDQQGLDLADYLRQENEISRTDAQELVAREVASIISNISEHGKAHIPQLGDLLTYGDGFVFRAIDLSSFVFEPISNIEQSYKQEEKSEEDTDLGTTPITSSEPEDAHSEEIVAPDTATAESTDEVDVVVEEAETPSGEAVVEEETIPVQEETQVVEEVFESHVEEEIPVAETTLPVEEKSLPEDEQKTPEVDHTPSTDDVVGIEENEGKGDPHDVDVPEPVEAHKEGYLQESAPLIQNRYQGSRLEESEAVEATEQPPVNIDQDYTYASEYVEDNNRSHMIWYILAAVVALSIIGALWYVTRPVSLYSGVNDVDMDDDTSPYAVEEEYRIPAASTDVVDTSQVLQERPDTANLAAQTPVTAPVVAADQPIIPANHHWYIVIGSRLPLDDAKDMVAEFNKKGQPRVRLIPGRGADSPATVIWDSYVTKEKADSALRHVRKNFVADAWHKAVRK